MHLASWILVTFTLLSSLARSQVLISEFMASNTETIQDEDGDFSDWIELHNPSTNAINLNGWFLTDRSSDLEYWELPAVELSPGAYILVFASEKDRRNPASELHTNFKLKLDGEYLALIRPDGTTIEQHFTPTYLPQNEDISFGFGASNSNVVLIASHTTNCYVIVPTNGSLGLTWTQTAFDHTTWSPAETGIGYDTGSTYDHLIRYDVQSEMRSINGSCYIRLPFQLPLPREQLQQLTLWMKYDDGFMAYLNGQSVTNALSPTVPVWNSLSAGEHTDSAAQVFENHVLHAPQYLVDEGSNVLALHGLNKSLGSSDALWLPELHAVFGIITNTSTSLYLSTPTPGTVNTPGALDFVSDIRFSVDRGFYTNSFSVEVTCDTADAYLMVTLNGSDPSPSNGTRVDAASGQTATATVAIASTTTLRARAFKDGYEPSNTDTQTYIFLDDVISQTTTPSGYPATWTTQGGVSNSVDYGMDTNITAHGTFGPLIKTSLQSLPTVCLSTSVDNLFSQSSGIYANPQEKGVDWERPTSMEWIERDGRTLFQVNCGLRIQGGAFRNPSLTDKHSFRVLFKQDYGTGSLKINLFDEPDAATQFDTLVLRAGGNDGYTWNGAKDTEQFTRDEFGRRLYLDLGHPSARGTFVHLYVNGLYWGMYNLCERPNEDFSVSYQGGQTEDWDANNAGEMKQGTEETWNDLVSQANAVTNVPGYMRIQGLNPDGSRNPAYPIRLDVANHADYWILNLYGGNNDWPDKNYWWGYQRTVASTGFKFYLWDFENTMGNNRARSPLGKHGPRNYNGMGVIQNALRDYEEYQLDFADRIHRYFFNEGLLTPNALKARYSNLVEQVEQAIIAESARWGDQHFSPPQDLNHWLTERDWILNTYIPQRSAIVMGQFQADGYYPLLEAPVFNQHGGLIAPGFNLNITNTAGSIHYTLDGSDPRARGGAIANNASNYTGTIALNQSTHVKVRALQAGTWSALNEALFILDEASPLRFTEVMYHPHAPSESESNNDWSDSDFAYIEIQNTGSTTLGLTGAAFIDGIEFDFTDGDVQTLQPGELLLVVQNIEAFSSRYAEWSILNIAGEYIGTLNKNGERIALAVPELGYELSLEYNTTRGWPLSADGAGHSLIPLYINDDQERAYLDHPGSWRASTYLGGSPGAVDPSPIQNILLNEIASHTDFDNPAFPEYDSNDWIELFNVDPSAQNLTDWYLSDDKDELKKWAIPSSNVIAQLSWLTFDETTGFHQPITNGFGINKAGENVFLSYLPGTADNRVADAIALKGQPNGSTWGRYPDGAPHWFQLSPTRDLANAGPTHHGVITEIMYNPVSNQAEYIIVHNPTGSTLPLSSAAGSWRIKGEIDYSFPIGTTLGANESIAIVDFPTTNTIAQQAFENAYGLTTNEVRLFGPFTGKLSDKSGRIALEAPQAADRPEDSISYIIIDELFYFDRAEYPDSADGTGLALHRLNLLVSGSEASNWRSGMPSPNTDEIIWPQTQLQTPSYPTLQWQALHGVRYTVEYTDQLNTPNWTPLMTRETNGVIQVSDPAANDVDRRYYQLRMEE